MSKRLLSVFISVFIIFSTSSSALAVLSPQDAISQSKLKFQQLDDRIIETSAEISSLNTQIAKMNDIIKKNNMDITESEKQIKASENELEKLNKDIESDQRLADKRIRAMYILTSKGSYLSVVLTSKSLSDFLFKVEAVQKIAALDRKLLKDLEEKKQTLVAHTSELNTKNQQLQQLKASNSASLEQLNTQKKELESKSKQFENEKKAAAAVIEENEEKLVAYSISVITSKTPTINSMKSAIETLKGLLPQLNTSSVKKKTENHIEEGNKKLTVLIAENSKPSGDDNGTQVYKATYSVVATAYALHGITATGTKPVRDPNGLSTIAVDPTVIPLGTKVFIPGYGYAICADTGGAIKGYKIDLYLNSIAECFEWGRRTVTLHIIAYPGEW